MDQLLQFFSNDYMPHGHCYAWLPSILWVNVISDLLIAVAYFSIPVVLVMVVRARKDIKFKGIFMLFAAFILMCGITHLIAIYTIWHGSYGWHGVAKSITAIVSVATALVLLVNRKAMVRIPTAYQLELALEKAESANIAKRNFLACMSHEIRTPINGLMGMLNLAIKNENNVEQEKRLNIAQKSAASLLTVINDIIDFSKVEAGKLDIEKVPFNMIHLLSDIVKAFSFYHIDRKVELFLDCKNIDVEILIGDPSRIRQVISNLISNAVKFTAKGEVRVIASVTSNPTGAYEFKCCIQDTGIGIPQNKIESLFTPFTQADSSTTREYGGTGLGLAICRQLTQLMGGDINVESREGVGSKFCFTIPIELPDTPAEDKGTFTLENYYKTDHSETSVLLISANPSAAEVYSSYLNKANYAFMTCTSIEEVVQQSPVMSSRIDLILLDADLIKGKKSKDLEDFIKSLSRLKGLWVIDYDSDERFRSSGLDITGYIDKPVSPLDLFAALSKVGAGEIDQTLQDITKDNELYPLNILIAEDNEINQAVIECMLEDNVESFSTAVNGSELLRMLKDSEKKGTRKFDLVFMDCQMPVMDGYEATRKIRAGEAGELYKNITIVAMTANAMDGDKERCLESGMDDYTTKPVSQEKVRAIIDKEYKQLMANKTTS
ncbi:ATP-binding protein [Aliiglaciecola litoralis]|uniref:histidine kinase n=1 Tax=Aliiglaciecola litoralis TaxID=582857 RepID=A0ABP3WN07_9ALTE